MKPVRSLKRKPGAGAARREPAARGVGHTTWWLGHTTWRLGHTTRRLGHTTRRLGHTTRRLGHTTRRLGPVVLWLVPVAVWTAVAVAYLALVTDANRGLDLSDESFYLMAAQPWAAHSSFNGLFGWYLRLIAEPLDYDVARLRVIGVVVLVACACWLGRGLVVAVRSSPAARTWPGWLRATVPGAVVSAALVYYQLFVRTPSYNWFASCGLLLVSGGLLRLLAAPRVSLGILARVSLSVGGGVWVAAIGKVTTGAAAVVVVSAAVAVAGRQGFGRRLRLLLGSGVVAAGAVVLHLMLIADLGTTRVALVRANAHLALVDPGHYTPRAALSTAWHGIPDALATSMAETHLVALLPLLGLAAPLVPAVRRHRFAVLGLLSLPGLVLPTLWLLPGFSGGQPGFCSAAIPFVVAAQTALLATLVGAAWAVVERTRPQLQDAPATSGGLGRDRALWVGPLALACLVLTGPLGSNNCYLGQFTAGSGLLLACAVLWLTAALLTRLSARVLTTVASLVLCGCAAVIVTAGREAGPYRGGPLDGHTELTAVVPGAPGVLLTPRAAQSVERLRSAATAQGWSARTRILDMAFMPGLVLALDGRPPNTLLPGFPSRSWRSTAYAVAHEPDPAAWGDAWLLVTDTQTPESVTLALAATHRRFPADYVLVTEVTPPRSRPVQLFRPLAAR